VTTTKRSAKRLCRTVTGRDAGQSTSGRTGLTGRRASSVEVPTSVPEQWGADERHTSTNSRGANGWVPTPARTGWVPVRRHDLGADPERITGVPAWTAHHGFSERDTDNHGSGTWDCPRATERHVRRPLPTRELSALAAVRPDSGMIQPVGLSTLPEQNWTSSSDTRDCPAVTTLHGCQFQQSRLSASRSPQGLSGRALLRGVNCTTNRRAVRSTENGRIPPEMWCPPTRKLTINLPMQTDCPTGRVHSIWSSSTTVYKSWPSVWHSTLNIYCLMLH
jgi:hypothetical protein